MDEAYRLHTSVNHSGPVCRNTFQIVRVEKADVFGSDSVIRFGQKVKIQANSHLHAKKLYLGSMPKSLNTGSNVSRLQEASLHANDSYNTQWLIDCCDPNERFERQGEPVKAGEPVLLRHCQTDHYFASDKVVEKNDFGSEFEVMTHSFSALNKTQNLSLERKGNITTDVPTRYQCEQNIWCFETAINASFDRPIEELQKFKIDDLLADLKQFLAQNRTSDAVKACLSAIHADSVDSEDFRWAMIDLGYNLSKREADEIVNHFDKSGRGCLSIADFVAFMC